MIMAIWKEKKMLSKKQLSNMSGGNGVSATQERHMRNEINIGMKMEKEDRK